jgi:two-component system, cell cycle sensor histidine kinase and response regulator CckA
MSKGQTLLVVEDDEETLNVLSRALASGGYDVVWARNADDTLKILDRSDDPIALIIVDVVLPGMPGPELVDEVRQKHPAADAIFISAYDKADVRKHGVDPDEVPFLAKPFSTDELLRQVETSLAGKRVQGS